MSELKALERDALVMSNARLMIKAHKSTSNWKLYATLFGVGCGTAKYRCRSLGLDPDSNITSCNDDYIRSTNHGDKS